MTTPLTAEKSRKQTEISCDTRGQRTLDSQRRLASADSRQGVVDLGHLARLTKQASGEGIASGIRRAGVLRLKQGDPPS